MKNWNGQKSIDFEKVEKKSSNFGEAEESGSKSATSHPKQVCKIDHVTKKWLRSPAASRRLLALS